MDDFDFPKGKVDIVGKDFIEEIKTIAKDSKITILPPSRDRPQFFEIGKDGGIRLGILDCIVCGTKTERISAVHAVNLDKPRTRLSLNALQYCPPGPRPLHKKRRNQTEAYHKRVQKKWDKKWRAAWKLSDKPVILSMPRLPGRASWMSAELEAFQSQSRHNRPPRTPVIKVHGHDT